jgi:hypothetical protein
MSAGSFHEVISEHLALRERNKRLERQMPLDGYREQIDGAWMSVSPTAPPKDELETQTAVNARQEHWLDHDSSWDASGERPLPNFDRGDD